MQKHFIAKPPTPSLNVPSKTIIITWLKSLFPDLSLSTKIQDFGDGVIYCRLLNHFHGNPPHSKITWAPKNEYQYMNNLKHVQTALLQLGITIPFDVNRVSKRKFLQNWTLINCFYKHFILGEDTTIHQQISNSSHGPHLHNNIVSHNYTPNSQHISHQINNTHVNYNSVTKRSCSVLPIQIDVLNNMRQSQKNHQMRPEIYWDHNVPLNLGTLAKNSLHLTQFLKQNINTFNTQNSPAKGKWSVGSQLFQNNYHIVIDRVKQILLKGSHDTQKVRQIKMLLGMTIQEQQIIKIEDDDANGHVLCKQSEVKLQQKFCKKQQEPKDNNKQVLQMINKQHSTIHSTYRQGKNSICKSNKKPFKI